MFYYGKNKTDNTPIIYDRTNMTGSPQHRAIFGVTGSGKGVLMKSEIVQFLERTKDTVYVLDLDGDYIRLAERFGGSNIHITQNSMNCINPIAIPDASSDISQLVVLEIPKILNKKELEIAIYMSLAAMWEKIEAARKCLDSIDKHFWIYIDNIMPLLQFPCCEKIFFNMIKSGRTHGCAVTYSALSFADFRDTRYGWQTLSNTLLISLLNQPKKDRDCLYELYAYGLTWELCYIKEQPCGNGLFLIGNEKIPFKYDQNVCLE